MTNDEPLERNLEALFSDAEPTHPQERSGADTQPGPTGRLQQIKQVVRPKWALGIRPRWVLGTFLIVVACAILARALWQQEGQTPPADTPSPLTKMAIGITAGLPVTPAPTPSISPPRTTVAARTALPMPRGGTHSAPRSAQPTASPTKTAAPVGRAPAAPSGLTAASIDATRIRLSWSDNSDDESGFRIYHGERFVTETGANVSSTTIGELGPDSYGCFHLHAFNESGASLWTEWACATTPSHTPTPTVTPTVTPAPTSTDVPTSTPAGQVPATPSSLRAIAIGATRVRLDWQDNASNETGFLIREGAEDVTVGADTESVLFTGLEPGAETCYTIHAFNYDGASNWIEKVCVTTPPMFIAAPMFGSGDTFDVAWGDYDNDGDLDLAVADDGEQNHLYVNQGGTFVQTEQFGAGRTWSLAWGDYDNNGYLDMAVGNGFGWAQNYLFTNKGDGGFMSAEQFDTASTGGLAWADFDDDGDLDLAVGNEWDQQNVLFVNRGSGRFAQVSQFGSGVTHAVAWGDVDNDGDPDLAVGNHGQNYVFVNDDGTFRQLDAFGAENTKALAWQDFDRDGDLDLAVGNDADQQNYLYINEGDGVFSESAQFGTGNTFSLAWGDYDNDGDADLAVGNFGDQANVLFANNGDGTFTSFADFGAGNTSAVAWGDFDNDGDLDLAVGNGYGQQNYLYINQFTALARYPPIRSSSTVLLRTGWLR